MVEREGPAAPHVLTLPKTVELEQRVARAEGTITELRGTIAADGAHIKSLTETIDTLRTRIVSLQAELDHLFGKIGRY